MKRILGVMLIALFIVAGCSSNKVNNISALSQIKVINKDHSSDWNQYWIEAVDPNSDDQKQFKIYMDEKMVWNLIKLKTTYAAEYEKEEGKEYKLTQILYLEDSDKYLNKEN